MDDGVVVMDAMGRIADLNPAAQALLAAPRSEMIGREARQALKRYPLLRQLLDDPGMMQTEIQIGADSRWYEAHLSPLLHARGFHLGKLLLLHDETEQKQARVAQLEQERLSAAESERQRVGRDLHDDLSQELAFINLQAQAASELLAAGQSHQAGAYLGRLAEVSREAQAKVRKQITGAMVTFAPEQGFAGVLGREVEQFGQKHGLRMEINIKNDGPTQALEPAVEVQLFHIIQEALANVYKHACASNVRVSLVANPAEVTVIVEDDGVGFDAAKLARGDRTFGLRIMAERAAEIGAAFQVASEPGQGTRVIVCIRNPKVHR